MPDHDQALLDELRSTLARLVQDGEMDPDEAELALDFLGAPTDP